MGLTMLGSRSQQAIEDMVSYAQETQHEKIMRGLAVGIALTMYGRLEEADSLVDTLAKDKDPILRRAAMHTLALAYCGTNNNQAVRKLLHVAVSDVNDDVRRAAVTALGFLLFRYVRNHLFSNFPARIRRSSNVVAAPALAGSTNTVFPPHYPSKSMAPFCGFF